MYKSLKRLMSVLLVGVGALAATLAFTASEAKVQAKESDNPYAGYPEDTLVHEVEGLLEYLDEEELIERSTLVVHGRVIGKSEPFKIRSVLGAVSVFTDYYVEISQVLRGDSASPGDTISVRIHGGYIMEEWWLVEVCEAADLSEGYEGLLYLYAPGMGGDYNTEGDYYYVTGEKQGSFEIIKPSFMQRSFSPDSMEFANDEGDTMVLGEVSEKIDEYTQENPVNEDGLSERIQEAYEENLQNGFMTQEEYDLFTGTNNTYAQIIE